MITKPNKKKLTKCPGGLGWGGLQKIGKHILYGKGSPSPGEKTSQKNKNDSSRPTGREKKGEYQKKKRAVKSGSPRQRTNETIQIE